MVPGGGTVGLLMDFFFSFSVSFSSSTPPTLGVGWDCTVLCTVLYCIVLYCTVLYCTVLYCTVLYCTVLYYTVLYCIVLYCTVKNINKGGLNCTVDHGSCAADALLFNLYCLLLKFVGRNALMLPPSFIQID